MTTKVIKKEPAKPKKAKIAEFANSLKGVITMNTNKDIWNLEMPR